MKTLLTLLTSLFLFTLPTQAQSSLDTLRNLKQPFPDIMTSGQPKVEDVAALKEAGVKTIINMRMPGEYDQSDIMKAASAAGINYVNIPVQGAKGLNLENAKLLAKELASLSGEKALVHCGSGNRAGAIFALKAKFLDGKSTAEALEVGKSAGMTRLTPRVEEILNGAEDSADMAKKLLDKIN